jgi:hypothetical protein
MVRPAAISGRKRAICDSWPPAAIAVAASTAVAKYGEGSAARPISSSTIAWSMAPRPWPP